MTLSKLYAIFLTYKCLPTALRGKLNQLTPKREWIWQSFSAGGGRQNLIIRKSWFKFQTADQVSKPVDIRLDFASAINMIYRITQIAICFFESHTD